MSGLPSPQVFRQIAKSARKRNRPEASDEERLEQVETIFLRIAMSAAEDGKFKVELPSNVIENYVELDEFVDKLELAGFAVDATDDDYIAVSWRRNPKEQDKNKV